MATWDPMSLHSRTLPNILLFLFLVVASPSHPQSVWRLDLAASGSLVPFGESITMTVRTAALSQGRVVYYDGTSILGYADLSRSGQAELETRVLRPGAHYIRAMVLGHPAISA